MRFLGIYRVVTQLFCFFHKKALEKMAPGDRFNQTNKKKGNYICQEIDLTDQKRPIIPRVRAEHFAFRQISLVLTCLKELRRSDL